MFRRRDPDWGQPIRNLGPAETGKHTRAARGYKPGCLDAVVAVAGSSWVVGYVVAEVIT